MINNAGVCYEYLPLDEIEMAEWREYFDINRRGELAQASTKAQMPTAKGVWGQKPQF